MRSMRKAMQMPRGSSAIEIYHIILAMTTGLPGILMYGLSVERSSMSIKKVNARLYKMYYFSGFISERY